MHRKLVIALLPILLTTFYGCYAQEPNGAPPVGAPRQQTTDAKEADLFPHADVFVVRKGADFHAVPKSGLGTQPLQPGDTLEFLYVKDSKIHVQLGDVEGWVERTSIEPVSAAWSVFAARIEKEPQDPYWLAGRGTVLASLEHYGSAERDLRRAIELGNNSAVVHGRLGDVLRQLGKFEEAIHHYDKACALNPSAGRYVASRGAVRLEMRNIDAALTDFQLAVEIPQDRGRSFVERAKLHLREKSFASAISDCTAALRLRPDETEAYFIRAEAYLYEGKRQEALADLEVGSNARPVFLVLHASEYKSAAENELEADATNSSALIVRAFAEDVAGDMNAARQTLAKLPGKSVDSPAAWLLRGMIHHRLDEHAEAIQAFDRAQSGGVWWSYMSLCRGRSHRALGRLRQALQDYRNATQLDPTRVESWTELLATLEQLGLHDQAASVADIAVLVQGGGEQSHVARGKFRLNRGLSGQALADAEDALKHWAFSGAAQQLRLQALAHQHGVGVDSLVTTASDEPTEKLSAKIDRLLRYMESSSANRNWTSYRNDVLRQLIAAARRSAPPPRVDVEDLRSVDLKQWYAKLARHQTVEDEIDYGIAHGFFVQVMESEPSIEETWFNNLRAVLPVAEHEPATKKHLLRERLRIPLQSVTKYRNRERLQQARELAERLITVKPEDVTLRLCYGDILRALLDQSEAIKAYNWVIERQPGNTAAYWGRGRVYLRQGEFALAKADFKQYADLGGAEVRPNSDSADQRQRRKKLLHVTELAVGMVGDANQELIFAEFAEPPPIELIQRVDGSYRTSLGSIAKYTDFVAKQNRVVVGATSLKLMADDLFRASIDATEQFLPTDLTAAENLLRTREYVWRKP